MNGWFLLVQNVPVVPEKPLAWMSTFPMTADDVLSLVTRFGLTLKSHKMGDQISVVFYLYDWQGNCVYQWYDDLRISRTGHLVTGHDAPTDLILQMSEYVLQRHCDSIAKPTQEVTASMWVFQLTELIQPGKRVVILDEGEAVKLYVVPEIEDYPQVIRAVDVFQLWLALTGYMPE